MFVVKRSIHNPILNPIASHPWEAEATFNWSPIRLDGDGAKGKGENEAKKIIAFYRAVGEPIVVGTERVALSTVGRTVSSDGGAHFEERELFMRPEEEWERFGCEDPRISTVDGKHYLFYTALSKYPFQADGIKVAVAELSDDLKKVEARHPVTPFNAKAMVLFPRRIGGKIVALVSTHTDSPPTRMSMAKFDKPEDMWSEEYWNEWHKNIDQHSVDARRDERDQIEVGAVPLEVPEGWLVVYSHIQDYGTDDVIFGIEALLLDKEDPAKIIGRTHGPIMVSEETYEKYGHVSKVTFPSGALINDGRLEFYYGVADTSSCLASVDLEELLTNMRHETRDRYITRFEGNPILSPISGNVWENRAVLNPAAFDLDDKVNILYRAMGEDNTSVVGLAISADGVHIDERLPEPVYVPRMIYEAEGVPGGNSGCEDARVTILNDRLYMCYTAYNGLQLPAVAVTSIKLEDYRERKFDWDEPAIITSENVDDKDACLLGEKIVSPDGEYYLFLHRIDGTVYADRLPSLDFKGQKVSNRIQVLAPRKGMWDERKVGMAAPPIKTEAGWATLYHGISRHGTYRVGAVLLDLKDPTSVLARTAAPIFEPREEYEQEGVVNHVVFPCGAVLRGDDLYIYYGGADKVVGVATMKLSTLIKTLTR